MEKEELRQMFLEFLEEERSKQVNPVPQPQTPEPQPNNDNELKQAHKQIEELKLIIAMGGKTPEQKEAEAQKELEANQAKLKDFIQNL